MSHLSEIPLLKIARTVAGYRATGGELNIDAALVASEQRGVQVTVPRIAGQTLEFVSWLGGESDMVGAFGIEEPIGGSTIALSVHDVVLAPLVAFDAFGNRLGQGGGFYDRALASCGLERPTVIGVAHSFQQIREFPIFEWDQQVDAVVSDAGVMEFKSGALDGCM